MGAVDNIEADIKAELGLCRGCATPVPLGKAWCRDCYWGKP